MIEHNKIHGVWNKNVGRKYTPRENGNKGVNNYFCKLNESKVIEIRSTFIFGVSTYKEFAEKYNISYQMISRIINKTSWTHI